MIDHGSEFSLGVLVLINLLVFTSAWWFAARRMTASRSQALLDAALLGYVIQYLAVGLPGMVGQLRFVTIAITAVVLSAALILLGYRRTVERAAHEDEGRSRVLLWAVAVFTIAFVLAYAQSQSALPVIANDALTYHFPAAAQWLLHQRIDLYQTWFFNPANTYSPLAGSTFIVWLIAPLGSDVLARFVEVPALLCVGLAVYRLSRELGGGNSIAALIAAAAVLCRPLFLQSMMGKDDLFLAFFFIATLVALSPARAREPFGACRIGVALGMMLATKYTALLAAPMLLLAVDWKGMFSHDAGSEVRPRAGSVRVGPGSWAYLGDRLDRYRWVGGLLCALVLAGPWYLRNWYMIGNPLFPLDISVLGIHLFHGLFTTGVSDALGSVGSTIHVVVGGNYGMPLPVVILLGLGWLSAIALDRKRIWRVPAMRACVIGPIVGFVLFGWLSPFPEVRFVVPEFLMLFAAAGMRRGNSAFSIVVVAVLPIVALLTIFVPNVWMLAAPFAVVALCAAAVAVVLLRLTHRWETGRRVQVLGLSAGLILLGLVYVYWNAYCRSYRETLHDAGCGYEQNYPDQEALWRFVNEHVPADATVAYTNLYMTYPLYGFELRRRLVYAPTRPGVHVIADLPWLGNHLSGEKLVTAADRATVADADRSVWLANLKACGARYLVIGRGGTIADAPEAAFVREDPAHFQLMFAGVRGGVFLIRDGD